MASSQARSTANGAVTYALTANNSGVARAGTINGLAHSVIQEAALTLAWTTTLSGSLELVLETAAPLTVVIEASDDLLAWRPILTATAPTSLVLRDIDPLAANRSVRSYRAVARP